MVAEDYELEAAAWELEALGGTQLGAESETGRGAATALLNLLHTLEAANGLVTPQQQQAALRVGLAQVDAAGDPRRNVNVPGMARAGKLNKPDVSFLFRDGTGPGGPTLRRMNVEIDTNPRESLRHQAVVNARDPNARNLYVVADRWTGEIKSARIREPGQSRTRRVPKSQLATLFQALPSLVTPASPPSSRRRTMRRAGRLREFEMPFEGELNSAAAELESFAEIGV
jgi:hypothetical protein